jgi:hypothetical protein
MFYLRNYRFISLEVSPSAKEEREVAPHYEKTQKYVITDATGQYIDLKNNKK